jgi:hypothetical protein
MISKNNSVFECEITCRQGENVLIFELDGDVKLTCRYVTFGTAMHENCEYSCCIKYFLELNNCKLGDHRNFMVVCNSFNLEEIWDGGGHDDDVDSKNLDHSFIYVLTEQPEGQL